MVTSDYASPTLDELIAGYMRHLANLELRAALEAADRAPRELDTLGIEQAWHELDEWARGNPCATTDPAHPDLTLDSLDRVRKALRHNGSRDTKTVAAQQVPTRFFSRTPGDPSGREPAPPGVVASSGRLRGGRARNPLVDNGFRGVPYGSVVCGTRCGTTGFVGDVEGRRG